MRRGVVGFVVAAAGVSLTACGAGSPIRPAATATSTVAPTAAATVTPAPTPAPTPPPQPLLIVEQYTGKGVLEAIDASGTIAWSFKLDTVIAEDDIVPFVGGPHVVLTGSGVDVVVLDRAGHVVGRGSTNAVPTSFAVDPTGTRWAWGPWDVKDNSDSGSIWVAGLGEAPHRVAAWTEDPGLSDRVVEWSDRGIITEVAAAGCGRYLQEKSSAVLDPATGRSTPLLGSDRHVTDVHAGLAVGITDHSVLVSGRATTSTARPASEGFFGTARISPDGAHVFGSVINADGGCGSPPRVETLVGDVAAGTWTLIPNVFAQDWYDNSHLVVTDGAIPGGLRVVDLQGKGGSATPLTHGDLIGVIP